jgi:hypothetical protein
MKMQTSSTRNGSRGTCSTRRQPTAARTRTGYCGRWAVAVAVARPGARLRRPRDRAAARALRQQRPGSGIAAAPLPGPCCWGPAAGALLLARLLLLQPPCCRGPGASCPLPGHQCCCPLLLGLRCRGPTFWAPLDAEAPPLGPCCVSDLQLDRTQAPRPRPVSCLYIP